MTSRLSMTERSDLPAEYPPRFSPHFGIDLHPFSTPRLYPSRVSSPRPAILLVREAGRGGS